jgi:HEAT repeat protein
MKIVLWFHLLFYTFGPTAGSLLLDEAPMDDKTVAALITELKTGNAETRAEAAKQLGKLGPGAAEAVSALIDALADPDRPVLLYSANALGKIGPKSKPAIPSLLRIFRDKAAHEADRIEAVSALARIGASSEVIRFLKEDDVFMKLWAVEALGACSQRG